MNHIDYLEYEGARLLDYALSTYSRGSSGSLVNDMERAYLSGSEELPSQESEALQKLSWEYMLYRLYIASSMIRQYQSGFGCTASIMKGLTHTLSHLPSSLRMLAFEKDLNGSYLLLGSHIDQLTHTHVENRFSRYAAIERACRTGDWEARLTSAIDESLAAMAEECSLSSRPALSGYLMEETRAFMRALAARLSEMTPESVHHKAHGKTLVHTHLSVFSRENYEHIYPSLTLIAGIMTGFLFMFA